MNSDLVLAPSVFAADLGNLREQLAAIEQTGVEQLHFDVMDGQFVERIAFGSDHLANLRAMSTLPIEAHLMVNAPELCVEAMARAGADLITFHQESTTRVLSTLQKIRATGAKSGLALNPATSEDTLKYILDWVDKVLVMTVNPGEGGQSFLEPMVEKIARIKELIGDRDIALGVDGSIDDHTIGQCRGAGATAFVSGGYLFKGDIAANITALRHAIDDARAA